ncbi:MAG: hypothetical protein M0C28_25705 [Candidatus Moduliflexus flocculans]|nr:hypothetical protein [Candidatus Moduliflexus flocculans]
MASSEPALRHLDTRTVERLARALPPAGWRSTRRGTPRRSAASRRSGGGRGYWRKGSPTRRWQPPGTRSSWYPRPGRVSGRIARRRPRRDRPGPRPRPGRPEPKQGGSE